MTVNDITIIAVSMLHSCHVEWKAVTEKTQLSSHRTFEMEIGSVTSNKCFIHTLRCGSLVARVRREGV